MTDKIDMDIEKLIGAICIRDEIDRDTLQADMNVQIKEGREMFIKRSGVTPKKDFRKRWAKLYLLSKLKVSNMEEADKKLELIRLLAIE